MIFQGPYFRYDAAPDLFLGRTGAGPLEVVWDTSILLDYLDYGRQLWEGASLDVADDRYLAELEALGVLISVWALRDIRFRVLERSIDDAKKVLSKERREARLNAVREVADALTLDLWDTEPAPSSQTEEQFTDASQTFELSRAYEGLPAGPDRELVHEAVILGAHVFLTRDDGILSCTKAVAAFGVYIASPLDLIEGLSSRGALAPLSKRGGLWPVPDLQRVSHLIQALGNF